MRNYNNKHRMLTVYQDPYQLLTVTKESFYWESPRRNQLYPKMRMKRWITNLTATKIV